MANNTQEFTVKINGIDVAIKNTADLNKAISSLEKELNNNTYGEAKLKEFQKTLDTVKTKGSELQKSLGKAAGFNVTIGGVPQFVSTIKQLEEAKEALDEKLKTTDVGSAAFAQLRGELQKVNTQLEVFEQSVEHVTLEKKLGTASAVVGSIGGAFATATAGAAVFGKQMGFDADKVKEYGDQADSLIGFLLGLKSVTEGVTGENLKNIKAIFGVTSARKAEALATAEGTAATEGATVASKIFGVTAKTAIASTGIGLLVVALVLLYENFDKVSSYAKKFGDYIQPLIAFAVNGFNSLADSIRNTASALTGGFIDDAATQKKQDIASDKLAQFTKEEDFQRKALDLQSKGELDRLSKTVAFEKKKLQVLIDSGDASEKEIKAQGQKVQEAEKASATAIRSFKEDVARKEIDLTAKTEGEKLRRVRDFEAQKLAELKKSNGTENELYQQQLLIVRAANKAILDDNKDKAKERYDQDIALKKQLIQLSNSSEEEKAKKLLTLQLTEEARTKKHYGANSKEAKDYYSQSLAAYDVYVKAIQAGNEKLQKIGLRDSIDRTKAKVAKNENALPGEDIEPLTNTDKFNQQLVKDIEKTKLPTVLVPIEISPIPVSPKGLQQRIQDVFTDVAEAVRSGNIPQINIFDSVFGTGFTNALGSATDGILNMSKDLKVKELDSQLTFLDEMDSRLDERISASQAKLDEITQQLNDSQGQLNDLLTAEKQAKGSEKDDIIKKIDIERTKRNQLANDKRKEDDRIKKAQAEQAANEKKRIELEQQRQKEIDKTNKVMLIAKAINDAVTAGLAIQAAIKAISGANDIPFPGNLAAIAVALAATVAAIGSAKAVFADGGLVPTDGNGVAVGASHATGGIPFTVAGQAGYEMEGGEHITNKAATANNVDALTKINRLGATQKFDVVPVHSRFADGGVVGNFSTIKSSLAATNTNAVNDKKFYEMQNTISGVIDLVHRVATTPITVGVDQITIEQNRVNVIQNKGLTN